MTRHLCSFIDLEGVLAPEMWPYLAKQFGIPELEATTREIADYRLLMEQRIAALARHRVTLDDICKAVAELDPFDGALEFIEALKYRGRVVIVSDSFRPMNEHFLAALPVDAVLCHEFARSSDGMIDGVRFWNGLAGKHLCFDAINIDGCSSFAMGDALNDLGMIRAASVGVLFRSSQTTRDAAPDLHATSTYSAALSVLDDGINRLLDKGSHRHRS